MGHGKSGSFTSCVQTFTSAVSVWVRRDLSPLTAQWQTRVSCIFKTNSDWTFIPKGLIFGLMARVGWGDEILTTTVLMFWGPYFSFMTSSQQCSVEMGFVEHESIRRRAGRAGSLRGGRRGRVHRGTTGYLRGLWCLVVLFKMHLGELRNNGLLIGARNHFCWDHKLKWNKTTHKYCKYCSFHEFWLYLCGYL